ncbi:MAG: hypothetical protein ACE5HO_13015 [bacterium]
MKKDFGLFLLLLVFFWNCTQDEISQPAQRPEPVLSDLVAPAQIYNASTQKQMISVRVQDDQGLENIAQVRYVLSKNGSSGSSAQGQLKDDGTQGDIVAKDGVFTAFIDGSFAQGDTGIFVLELAARDVDGNISNRLEAEIEVLAGRENLAPQIVRTLVPQQVAVDSSFEFVVAVAVEDADGRTDIQRVLLQFFPPAHPNPTLEQDLVDDGSAGDVNAADGLYSGTLSSGLFKEASDYFLRFQAEDQAGNTSQPVVVSIHGFFVGNRPPVISNVVAPNTVKIDPNQSTRILITVDVTDPQGLSDIDYVQFRSFLPGGQEADNSPTQLADDGDTANTGDVVAGDGTFSRLIVLPSSGVPLGDFRFEFQAQDNSGALSNIINHILTVTE